MTKNKYGVACCSVVLLSLIFFSTACFSASRALVRFAYTYHAELTQQRFQQSFNNRLNAELDMVCASDVTVTLESYENHPSKLIERVSTLFQVRAKLCINGIKNLHRLENLTGLSDRIHAFDGDRYVLFASESSVRMESSLGHIAILYQDPDNLFFSPVITFSADSVFDLEASESNFMYFIKGGLSHIDGRLRANYFFDHYSDLVMKDGRYIEKYKILETQQRDLKAFDHNVVKELDKTQPYNFFSANCSTKLLNLLMSSKKSKTKLAGFESPANHLNQLISDGHIKYESTLLDGTEASHFSFIDKNHLKRSTVYPSEISLRSDSNDYQIELTAFSTNRSWDETRPRYYDSKLASFSFFTNSRDVEFTLIETNTINSYQLDGASSFLTLGYDDSFKAHYYRGGGYYVSNLGGAINIGCDIDRGCGVFTAFVYHKKNHSFKTTLKSDREGNEFKFKYLMYITPQLNTSYSYKSKSNWIGLSLRF